jgi:hypothetical protein
LAVFGEHGLVSGGMGAVFLVERLYSRRSGLGDPDPDKERRRSGLGDPDPDKERRRSGLGDPDPDPDLPFLSIKRKESGSP